MLTFQSVLLYGRYEWQPELQPVAEFKARLNAVRQLMRKSGWHALVVLGDSRENAALCYLTNLVPNQRWGLALIDASSDQPPQLVASVGPRDLPAIQRLTWVENIQAAGDINAALSQWLMTACDKNGWAPDSTKIGIVKLARMRADIGRNVTEVCGSFGETEDATEALAILRRSKSPNELKLLRTSYEILQRAFAEIERQRQAGSAIAPALIAAERIARLAGAQDVRSLYSPGGSGQLRPLSSASPPDSAEPWGIYLAVRYCGYWTEAMKTLGSNLPEAMLALQAAIQRALDTARPGASVQQLLEAMKPQLAGLAPHEALGPRIGRAHGLSLDAEPWITSDSRETLVENGAYIITAGATDVCGRSVLESATVMLDGPRHSTLWPMLNRLEHQ
jgi:Xaa-Pro aminopeptidase